eukprot:413678_1
MGSFFSGKPYDSNTDKIDITKINVRSQMNLIICHWVRKNKLSKFPSDLVILIIDEFTFRYVFHINHHNTLLSHYDYLFKVLVIGDSGVGKRSLCERFIDDEFCSSYITTLSFHKIWPKFKTVTIDDKKIKLQILPTIAMNGRFGRNLASSYYRGVHGILLVFDTTDRISFMNIRSWNYDIERHTTGEVKKVLIASKCDLFRDRIVTFDEAKTICDELNVDECIETSAKTGKNVEKAFVSLLISMWDNKSE